MTSDTIVAFLIFCAAVIVFRIWRGRGGGGTGSGRSDGGYSGGWD